MVSTSDDSNIGELQSDKPTTPGPDKLSSSNGPIHSSTPESQMNNSTQGSQNSSGTLSFTPHRLMQSLQNFPIWKLVPVLPKLTVSIHGLGL